jgi:hypothetical protein
VNGIGSTCLSVSTSSNHIACKVYFPLCRVTAKLEIVMVKVVVKEHIWSRLQTNLQSKLSKWSLSVVRYMNGINGNVILAFDNKEAH